MALRKFILEILPSLDKNKTQLPSEKPSGYFILKAFFFYYKSLKTRLLPNDILDNLLGVVLEVSCLCFFLFLLKNK